MCSIGGIEDGDVTKEGCQKFDACEKRQESDSGLRQQLTADQAADTKTHHECRLSGITPDARPADSSVPGRPKKEQNGENSNPTGFSHRLCGQDNRESWVRCKHRGAGPCLYGAMRFTRSKIVAARLCEESFKHPLIRACRQLSHRTTQTSRTPAKNVSASLSKRVAMPL
jgi:hypothetical protein